MSREELVEGFRKTLEDRDTAKALVAGADAEELRLDALATKLGFSPEELMTKAYSS